MIVVAAPAVARAFDLAATRWLQREPGADDHGHRQARAGRGGRGHGPPGRLVGPASGQRPEGQGECPAQHQKDADNRQLHDGVQ